MKQFFEQYGGVALGILALLVLIAMITPVGNIIKTSLQGTTEKFSTSINGQADNMTNQITDIMNTAGDFLNVKEDGKMYKGDVLYTGWDGDKAYYNGIEQHVHRNAAAGPNIFIQPGRILANNVFFLYYKVDGKTIAENFNNGDSFHFTCALNVSRIEMAFKYPSTYNLQFANWDKLDDYSLDVIEEKGGYITVKLSGVLNYISEYGDVEADDFYLTLK